MPTLDPVAAKDDLFRYFTDAFKASCLALNIACELRYQGRIDPKATPDVYAKIAMVQVQSPQKAFVDTDDGADQQVFETSGLFTIAIRAAMSSGDASRKGDLLAVAARNIVRNRNTPGGIWLRNAKINELPNDTEYYRWNVIAEYEFDEVG